MRDILFRGMTKNQEWVEGGYCNGYEQTLDFVDGCRQCLHHYIAVDTIVNRGLSERMLLYDVLPETVGQYTGLCDKNGVRIFEGDIVETRYFGKDDGNGHNFNDCDTFVVKWDNSGFCIESKTRKYSLYEDDESIGVIGNIHEDKELLEGVYG